MKKRFITKCLAGVIACSMAISPLSVYAGGDPNANYTPIEENTGDVSTNYSEIASNSGTVESNGTSEVQTATIESNSGTVVDNYATVECNNNDGIVENNCFRGTIETNNGQVDSNSGTVNINNGNIDKTNATVGTNNGTIETANYYSQIGINGENGWIANNYGKVNENAGTITNNEVIGPFTGTVETNKGTIENNNGSVTTNEGAVETNNGYVKNNNNIINEIGETGDVAYNNGTVEVNKSKDNHGIAANRGTIVDNSGRVDTNEQNGIINNNSEYVSTNEGTVETNTGKIVLNIGEVTDNFGEIEWNYKEVINNFGGIIHGTKALNEFFEYILGDGGAVDDANSDTLRTVDNRTWVGTNQKNKENVKLTVKANDGKTLDKVTDEEGNSVDATDNGDGTWSIVGAMKKIFFSWTNKSDPTPGPNPGPGPKPGPNPDPNPWVEPENIVEVYESEVAENVAPVSKTTILVVVDNLTDEEIKLVTCFLKGAASVKGKNVEYKFVTSKELTADNLASASFVLNVSKLGTKKAKIENVKSFNLWLVDNDEYTSDASNIYINVNEDSNNVAEAGRLFAKLF